jgi:hypothetical protein
MKKASNENLENNAIGENMREKNDELLIKQLNSPTHTTETN